ncbi:hypothetical protein Micbo1qcDRAFT_159658 [Microdochium bolleyi]|uniref:Peroxin 11C n=1 Tax=Microdochium bolleyi TaxID=196109 RepID=A0A136JBD3_9PEZI|nr:hypothetical protein Micbo1qcDRAFT_159658 [Microdochium bolleyi]
MSASTEPSKDPAPPATALPTGDPVPSAPSSTPAPKAKPLPLKALLLATPSNVDAFLAHFQRCLQTPAGIDNCLLLACYSTRLTGALLELLVTGPAIQRGAAQLVALASALPPSATLVFSSKAFPSPSVAALLGLSQRLKAFAAMISEGRTFLRLWGLIGMYFWARGLVFKLIASRKAASAASASDEKSAAVAAQPRESLIDTTFAWTQLLSCIAFQSLENRAFLASKGVLPMDGPAIVSTFRWSARFWGTFVGLEIGRLAYEKYKRSTATPATAGGSDGKSLAAIEQEDREWTDTWRKQVARNCAWFPLTVHWGLEQGLVPEVVVGALPLIPGIISIRDLWRRTAA